MHDDDITTGELRRNLEDLRGDVRQRVSVEVYRADRAASDEQRRALADDDRDIHRRIDQVVKSFDEKLDNVTHRLDERDARQRALIALAVSGFVLPLIVALIAAGAGKGLFG